HYVVWFNFDLSCWDPSVTSAMLYQLSYRRTNQGPRTSGKMLRRAKYRENGGAQLSEKNGFLG
ncbi:hypothetical protein, partial [Escherichia coli]|uniref:hypothetical protein n=1 Tax=Escherichia coli TaxID=562 RepID=UPI001F2E0C6A